MKGGSAAPAKTDAAAPNSAAGNPGATPPDPNAGKAADTKQAGSKAPAVTQVKKGLVSIPTTTGAAPTGPAPTAADSPTAITEYWNSKLSDASATPADAKDALDAINPLIPKLSGVARSNASYVQFLAYGSQNDQDRMCRSAKDIIANDPTGGLADSTKHSSHVKSAQQVIPYCK
jgi:hypothetical protein